METVQRIQDVYRPVDERVKDVKEDRNTNATYYELEDDFTSHRFYFEGEQKYQKGDSCILEVAGINDKQAISARVTISLARRLSSRNSRDAFVRLFANLAAHVT